MTLRIAPCTTIAAFHACEDVQLAVWGGSEREAVPYDMLRAIAHAGGTVVGAWDGDTLVGMAMSIVGWDVGGAYHHSHLLGVLPAYRSSGVGERLKLAQREQILAQGLDRMTWTYDPLESPNARLNIAKLGAESATYLPDFYGTMPEALNAGLPSDRLLVTWHLDRPLLPPSVPPPHPSISLLLRYSADGAPEQVPPMPDAAMHSVEIPALFQAIKTADFPRAHAWRFAVRDVLTRAFGAGYIITGYLAPRQHRDGCGCYLLIRRADTP